MKQTEGKLKYSILTAVRLPFAFHHPRPISHGRTLRETEYEQTQSDWLEHTPVIYAAYCGALRRMYTPRRHRRVPKYESRQCIS